MSTGVNVAGMYLFTIPGILGVSKPIEANGKVVNGGGLHGYMPPPTMDVDKTYPEYEHIRFSLREAWNTHYKSQLYANLNTTKSAVTPFRAVTNSGDLLSRNYYSCGGACQTFQSRPGMFGIRQRLGGIHSACDGTNIPPATCNVRYVYDSSDYVTYLKQKAVSQNYNDITNAGNSSSASQSVIRRIKRY